jgi:hypothetical protein
MLAHPHDAEDAARTPCPTWELPDPSGTGDVHLLVDEARGSGAWR